MADAENAHSELQNTFMLSFAWSMAPNNTNLILKKEYKKEYFDSETWYNQHQHVLVKRKLRLSVKSFDEH